MMPAPRHQGPASQSLDQLADLHPTTTPAPIPVTTEAAIASAADTAGPVYVADALEALHRWCLAHPTVHVDDPFDTDVQDPIEARSRGAVFLTAARRGWIEKVQLLGFPEDVVAARPSERSRGGLKPVWRSKIFTRGTSQ